MLVDLDATWVISGAMYWSVIELNIGILAASIPSYKTIAKRYAPRLLGTSEGGGSRSHKKSTGGSGMYKMSGFQKISNNQHSKSGTTSRNTHHDSTIMDLRNLDTDGAGTDSKHRRMGSSAGAAGTGGGNKMRPHVATSIEPTSKLDLDNSSEEALCAPKGQISVKTQITTQYEG